MVQKAEKNNKMFMLGIFFLVIFSTVLVIGAIYYWQIADESSIDSGDGISEPHNSGDITVEVDYMRDLFDSESDLEDELDDITELFAVYGLNVTFIIDDRLTHVEEIGDSDAISYYNDHRGLNTTTYMLIANKHSSSSVLGSAYSKLLIVVFRGKIEDSLGNTYKVVATQYVTMHEIAHTYGCVHSEEEDDILYPTLSVLKCADYPTPQFTDINTLAELHD